MPPKKAQTTAESQPDAAAVDSATTSGIEAWELPKTLVTKIAKAAVDAGAESENSISGDANGSVPNALPTKFTKDATLSLVKGSTVFINYVAATAHDIALSRSHKTIAAADIIKALEQLEFGDIAAILPGELEAYRAAEKAKKAAVPGPSKKGKEKETTEKITLTIPGGQKKPQTPNQSQIASSLPPAASIPGDEREDQVDSMVVEGEDPVGLGNDGIDDDVEDEDEGGHDHDMDVDVDEGGGDGEEEVEERDGTS